MGRAILLTGHPGCGKTTLVRKVLGSLRGEMGGFVTEEVRRDGDRWGFRIVTLAGQGAMLAHADRGGLHRVGRYGVDVSAIDATAVASIEHAIARGGLVVIDEIGPMELFSARFRAAVLDALASPAPVLGTIVRRPVPFADALKTRDDVQVLEVTPQNRDALVTDVVRLLQPMLGSLSARRHPDKER